MNKSLVVFSTTPTAYAPNRLKNEAALLEMNPSIFKYARIHYLFSGRTASITERGMPLPNANYVILREPGSDGNFYQTRDVLLGYYKSFGSRILNQASYERWSVLDKITQTIELQKASVPFISTSIYCSRKQIRNADIQFPLIVKAHLGSKGRQVWKADNKIGLEAIITQRYPSTLLVQPFLPGGEDVRVITLGDKILGAMKRTVDKGQYLTNYSAGGKVEIFGLDSAPEVADIALRTSKHFLCECAGVDLMRDQEGCWKVIEINRACQFQGFEKSTGINVAKKILEYLQSRV